LILDHAEPRQPASCPAALGIFAKATGFYLAIDDVRSATDQALCTPESDEVRAAANRAHWRARRCQQSDSVIGQRQPQARRLIGQGAGEVIGQFDCLRHE
jgi:hypothetical protein